MSGDLSAFGLAVGHATDEAGATGLTVIRGIDGPLRAGVAVFGRATGSRELNTASPNHLVDGRVDAILLSGGSAFGLDAAAGVMRWMEERKRGVAVGGAVVPIVPTAILFDLAPLGRMDARPTPAMAYDACEHASPTGVAEGSVGAGTGATVGKLGGLGAAMKGGFGYVVHEAGELRVAAFAVLNAVGDVRDAEGRIIAGARTPDGHFIDAAKRLADAGGATSRPSEELALRNTTLAAVATNVALTSVELAQLAQVAGAALFKRITPAATRADGDTVFSLSPLEGAAGRSPGDLMHLEALAVQALEAAIERAVRTARGRDGIPGLGDNRNGD